ncbi:MAG: hypothetical protein ACHQQS_06190 [Thermoanaerobaculales bacterium]
MIRWLVRIVGTVLVLVLGGVLVVRMYGARRLAAAEREFNTKFGDVGGYASAKVPDEENAAIYIRAGAEAVVLLGNDKPRAGDLSMVAPRAWSEDDRAFLRGLLARNAAALDLLHRAAELKRSSFGLVDGADLNEELKDKLPLLKILWAQRLLLMDADAALHDGDRARFLTDARTMSTLATAMDRESPMISLLIGVAAEKIFLSAVDQAVEDPGSDLAMLTALRGSLMDIDLRAAWRRTNGAEERAIHERVPRSAARPPDAGDSAGGWLGRVEDFVFGDLLHCEVLNLRRDAVAIVDQPYGSNPPWVSRGLATPRTMFGALEKVLFPSLANAAGRVQTALSQRNLAWVALALRAQALTSGSYPASLVGAVEDPSRPDPFVGKPLAYVRHADGSAEVGLPDGAALADKLMAPVKNWSPFIWKLPAPPQSGGESGPVSGSPSPTPGPV